MEGSSLVESADQANEQPEEAKVAGEEPEKAEVVDQIKEQKQFLPRGVRGIVYSYLPFDEILKTISKLSKAERAFLAETRLLDWRPEGKVFSSVIEEQAYRKHINLQLNSKLTRHNMGRVTRDKVEYYISVAEVVVLIVDHHTVENVDVALMAKYALDKCIEMKKQIELVIMVEQKIDINKLTQAMVTKESAYMKHISEIEIHVGRFHYRIDEEDRPEGDGGGEERQGGEGAADNQNRP